jgi:hypothetical protein
MRNQPNALALYLRDLGALLKERAFEARARRDAEKTEFDAGRTMAYYEVLSTMQNKATAFGLTLEELQLEDVDPDRDFFSKGPD